MVLEITVDDALAILANQLSYSGYMMKDDYTLADFFADETNETYFLSGMLGRGFQLHKKYDADRNMYLFYSQYPEYETVQSFAWVLNRNKEWSSYRIVRKIEAGNSAGNSAGSER